MMDITALKYLLGGMLAMTLLVLFLPYGEE